MELIALIILVVFVGCFVGFDAAGALACNLMVLAMFAIPLFCLFLVISH